MNFDTLNIASCIVPAAPVLDQRCSDAAFASANPTICGSSAYLVLKPGVSLICALGSVDYRVFQYKNGVETEVTSGVVFSSSDNSVIAIGVNTGSATGIGVGVSIITATYAGMTATSDVTVLAQEGCCDSINVNTAILIDNSIAMGLAFGSGYATRLNFAKSAALSYAGKILTVADVPKDGVKVWSFASTPTEISSGFINDTTQLAADVNSIVQTQETTDVFAVLEAAIADLLASTADEKVIVLLTDGDQPDTSNVQSILDAAAAFKAAGGTIVCIGVRSNGTSYDMLSRAATGGLFLNALPANVDSVLGGLSYIKSILCAGECEVVAASNVPTPALNFSSFTNWEVIHGMVNLIGAGFLDLQPGNGLYVQMAGGTSGNPSAGTIRSIDTFDLKAGRTYRIAFRAAGNNLVNPDGTMATYVGILDAVNADPQNSPTPTQIIFEHTVAPAWNDQFAPYAFTFTAAFDVTVKIVFAQQHAGSPEWHGSLLDSITFDEVSTLTNLLTDDFDTENEHDVASSCLGIGYNCDECVAENLLAQEQDPNPLPNIESGQPPTVTYTSTKTQCATCGNGFVNGLDENLVPTMTDDTTPSGEASASSLSADAWKAFGASGESWGSLAGLTYPLWLQYEFETAVVAASYSITADASFGHFYSPKDWTFEGSNNGTDWTVLDTQAGIMFFDGQTAQFTISNTDSYLFYRLNVSANQGTNTSGTGATLMVANLSIFGASEEQVCSTKTATSLISQADADSKAEAAALAAAQAQLTCVHQFTSTQSYTASCPVGSLGSSVTKSATETSLIDQATADAAALASAQALAVAELVCSGSNNTQPISIPAQGTASPYPSVKSVTGLTGHVTKIVVTLKKFTHQHPDDVIAVLMSPTGSTCVLMANCGGATAVSSGIDLVLDDAAGSFLPFGTPLAAGTFKPKAYPPYQELNPPGPQQPHGTTLAAFNGIDPNGSWSLWVIDDSALDSGAILEGFELTIVSS